VDFFKVACQHDLEGIVAKWAYGTYKTDGRTSWLKVRNPRYSHWDGRREFFKARRGVKGSRSVLLRPQLELR
jgi:hypothetical protein